MFHFGSSIGSYSIEIRRKDITGKKFDVIVIWKRSKWLKKYKSLLSLFWPPKALQRDDRTDAFIMRRIIIWIVLSPRKDLLQAIILMRSNQLSAWMAFSTLWVSASAIHGSGHQQRGRSIQSERVKKRSKDGKKARLLCRTNFKISMLFTFYLLSTLVDCW